MRVIPLLENIRTRGGGGIDIIKIPLVLIVKIMIILRQKNYSILNNLGLIGNSIGNKLSRSELDTRSSISSRKSKKLREDVLKHVKKYHKVSEKDDILSSGFLPNKDNLEWEPGKEPKGFDIFAGKDPDRVRYNRSKIGSGNIQIGKKIFTVCYSS